MPTDENGTDKASGPEVEVVGPPILTVYFKNKRDDDDKPVAGQQEVLDFSVNGSFLIAQTLEGELMVFPNHELEYATLTPQLSIKEGEDAETVVDDEGAVGGTERSESTEGGKLITPNFGGGSEGGETPTS